MKVRRKKLLAVLLCAALSVTGILPAGFSTSASELEQPNLEMYSGNFNCNRIKFIIGYRALAENIR